MRIKSVFFAVVAVFTLLPTLAALADSPYGGGPLSDIARIRDAERMRDSSYDRSGGNNDRKERLLPGETHTLMQTGDTGCIRHIWITINHREQWFLRKLVIRMYWDGSPYPSVEVPIGDFFGMGHGQSMNFSSAGLAMSPKGGRGFNCYFPMPFSKGAKITVENQGSKPCGALYYYVDWERYDKLDANLGRFHAQWRRQKNTNGLTLEEEKAVGRSLFRHGKNTTGENNYVILEATGTGHYIGCNLNTHNLRALRSWNWYGEGDDMIYIDGDKKPTLIGTGTEDYFNMAWCPREEYQSPNHGLLLPGGPDWFGKVTNYRYHVEDPVQFKKSIKVTIEHGHNNHRIDDLSSTAYWYQSKPIGPMVKLPPVEERLPLPEVEVKLPGWTDAEDLIDKAQISTGELREATHINNGIRWGQNRVLTTIGAKNGTVVKLPVEVAEAGKYELQVYFSQSHLYGQVQCSIDGKNMGGVVDCYADAPFRRPQRTPLARMVSANLTAGSHTIEFHVVGRNPFAIRSEIAIDCFKLVKPKK
jgi:D-arabinan exo alpha-(1,3)/(1,5)-arabinofuranosidase (non-reducing end)